MANYVIGDIQGCYDQLVALLAEVAFQPRRDRLWLAGDLVNRGFSSLAVLRFLVSLPVEPVVTLGNHDLHLLAVHHGAAALTKKDTFQDVLAAPDAAQLCTWLQSQHLIYYDQQFDYIMVHAGLAPQWQLDEALAHSKEIEQLLQSPQATDLLHQMYGDAPDIWSDNLHGIARWRTIINYCTRMRFCDEDGRLALDYKGKIVDAPSNLVPWFALNGCWQQHRVVFGHWAALAGEVAHPHVVGLDTGCVWGGLLTAMRLEDGKIFQVKGWQTKEK